MRPDEHKKKKNAAYKKKHGITKDASDNREENSKREKVKSTGERSHDPQTKKTFPKNCQHDKSPNSKTQLSASGVQRVEANGSAAYQAKVLKSSSCSSSSDSETTAATSKKKSTKSFRRREIASNWQKYELQPDVEEKVSARGENYEKLLNMAGEAISHFRFKDELDWDDSADSLSEKSNDTYSQFLSVNTTDLVQSLACLPVHQILGINQDVFPAEQLTSVMNIVKERSAVYAAKMLSENTGHSASPAGKNVSTEVSNSSIPHTPHEGNQQNDLLSVPNLRIKDHSALTTTPEQKVNTITSLVTPGASLHAQTYTNDRNSYTGTKPVTKEAFIPGRSDNTLKKSDEKFILSDDDLDALLGMDNPSAEVAGDIKNASSRKETTVESSTVTSDIRPSTVKSSSAGGDSKLAAENDSLEAWLDSVLDD